MSSDEIDGDANDVGNDDGVADELVVSESINPNLAPKSNLVYAPCKLLMM